MTKPSASWRRHVRSAASQILFLLLVTLPALASAGDPTAAGKAAAESVLDQYSGKDAFNANVSQPLTNTGTPLTTVDGTVSGSGQILAPSSNAFVQIAVQPAASGDLAQVLVFQDLDLNGQFEYGYTAPLVVSGVCANGVISCNAGTWLECKPFAWTADAGGQASLADSPLDDLGGCYCINNSCGSNLVWNNLPLVLKDLGGGVVGAVQRSRPAFVVTDVKTENVAITYYGMDTSRTGNDQNGAPLTGTVDQTQYYDDPGQLSGATEALLLSQASDPNSFYAMSTTSLQNRQDPGTLATCQVERTITIPEQESFCPLPSFEGTTWVEGDYVSVLTISGDKLFTREGDFGAGGTGITFRDIDLTQSYLGPKTGDSVVAVRLDVIYDAATDTSKLRVYRASLLVSTPQSPQLASELTALNTKIRLYDHLGKETTSLEVWSLNCWEEVIDENGGTATRCEYRESFKGAGLWRRCSATADTVMLLGDLPLGAIRFEQHPKCPLEGGSACFGDPLRCTTYDLVEGLDDRCLAYANNPDCALRDETVDGVVTYQGFNPTGLTPVPSCRPFDLPDPFVAATLCKDWWLKERTYLCEGDQAFDFTDAKKRIETVNESVDGADPLAGSLEYTDARKDPDSGVWTTDTHTLEWNVPPPSPPCQVLCKTRKIVSDAEVNMTGPVTEERTATTQYEFVYKECGGGAICPTGAGEEIITPCECINEFTEAASAMSAIEEAANDMICTSGVPQ